MSFRAFSSRRSSLTQTFVESCVDFEVAYLSVWFGDSYLKVNARVPCTHLVPWGTFQNVIEMTDVKSESPVVQRNQHLARMRQLSANTSEIATYVERALLWLYL